MVRWSTNEISTRALSALTNKIDSEVKDADSIPVVIFNPLGWERNGDVTVRMRIPPGNVRSMLPIDASHSLVHIETVSKDERGQIADVTLRVSNIPAFGYKVLPLTWKQLGSHVAVTGPLPLTDADFNDPRLSTLTIENKRVRVEVDRSSGCIVSLYDLRSGYETLAPGACGNQLQFFKDNPTRYDAWNIDPGTLDQTPILPGVTKVEIVDGISMSPGIRITRTWQSSRFVQTIRLDKDAWLGAADSDIVDIENDIDWHERHILLKDAFPLAVTSNFATYEIPYGTIERPTTRNNSWEQAQFEVPALRWADISGVGADGKVYGLSLLNQDKYGYDAAGNVLRLTLLRSPTSPDPDADQGHHHFHFALYPHAGTWKDALTVRHGWEYDYPLTAVVTTSHIGSLPAQHSFGSVSPDNVVLTAVKKAEDSNGLIFRVYEWAGKDATAEFHVPQGATGATVTNLMETPQGNPLEVRHQTSGDAISVPIHPYEILTIRVDYPASGPKE